MPDAAVPTQKNVTVPPVPPVIFGKSLSAASVAEAPLTVNPPLVRATAFRA